MKGVLFKIGLGAAVAVMLGFIGLYLVVFASNTTDFSDTKSIQIPKGTSFESTIDSLYAQDIVESTRTLSLMGKLTGWGNQVKAGNYNFERGQSNYDILQTLRRGLQTPVRVVIPPGTRKDVIAAVVASEMAFEKEDFLAALADSSLAAELGTDTLHLFAYMMPETYFFYWLTSPENVVRKVKQSFDSFYAENAQGGNAQNLSADEIVRVASLVEWESDLVSERPTIAGVYLNRLRDGWRLDADPTVQFALIQVEGQKRRLYFRDYKIDHPFNTYLFRGLPPGPVTNPAPTAVAAALQPEDHGYYYFVARGDGSHTFSRTLREHNRAAADYRRRLRESASSN
ncbi:MAG: endolytic transglycosylase MltG [Rhodothermales bacterium]|nr:endolytic transglycosylase MltG [Rhodothermales bacterium]